MMAKNFATLAPDKATLAGLEEYQKTLEEAKGMPI